jgi:hypothetical protein
MGSEEEDDIAWRLVTPLRDMLTDPVPGSVVRNCERCDAECWYDAGWNRPHQECEEHLICIHCAVEDPELKEGFAGALGAPDTWEMKILEQMANRKPRPQLADYGHWEGQRFLLNEERIRIAADASGVHEQRYREIDLTHALLMPDLPQETLDRIVLDFITSDDLAVPASEEEAAEAMENASPELREILRSGGRLQALDVREEDDDGSGDTAAR